MKKGIIVGALAVGAIGYLTFARLSAQEVLAVPTLPPMVETQLPIVDDIQIMTDLIGTVEPENSAQLFAKMTGDVTEVFVKAGDMVTEGQVLCIVDTNQVDSAKNTMDSASLSLRQAQEELSRQSVLYQAGGVSEQLYQKAKDSVSAAQINYNNAKTNYENQLSYSEITAPISGVVETFYPQTNKTLKANELIAVISGEGSTVVSFSTTERIKSELEIGDEIIVEKDENEYKGTIYEISSMANGSTGLFDMKAELNEQGVESSLTTGSNVKLSVVSSSATRVITVPIDSVYYEGGIPYIYTYVNGVVSEHAVEVGIYDSEVIEVKSGINIEDEVITTWSTELYEGSSVRKKGEDTASLEASAVDLPEPSQTRE